MRLFKGIERAFARWRQERLQKRIMKEYGQSGMVEKFMGWQSHGAENAIGKDSNIWVCWWQGEENMPPVVQVCYRQLRKMACGHPVVLITEENCKDYVNIPHFIWEKYRKGIISRTHFSDILRFCLLKEHGGIWIDITNFVTREIDSFVPVEKGFYSCRHITKYNNVSRGLWTSYFNASGKGNVVPSYLYESLVNYWSTTDKLVDYLVLDFIFKLGYDNVPAIREAVDSLEVEEIGTMRRIMDRKWNKQEWDTYYAQAGFQKLSYKKYTNLTTKKGEKTHYAYLVENF